MRRLLCPGFGEYTGKCGNVHAGAVNPVWCKRCDALRVAHLDRQFRKIAESFEAKR